ncbi:MAG TPA: acyltransferase family protein, partial [Rhizomicrobium sp.]|nr:acyltransferase family protein [Rhizomicrobium sp.]
AAAIILFPLDFERYADSLFATAFFASNFEFWREVGYFDVSAEWKPLLHLWSIAVEEQFYLVFPAILLLLHTQSRRKLLAVVGALFVLSLGFSIWASANAPSTGFYLLPSRFWELMLGAILALAPISQPSSRIVRESIGIGGLALIGVAVFWYTRDLPFPGAYALLPCIGTALLIYAGATQTLTSRVLSLKPVVFIGLISYSLYLWHWPLLVFTQIALNRALLPWESVALIAVSVVLATLSWRFVEQPVRRNASIGRVRLFAGAASAMALTALCGFGVASANGLPQRLQPEIRRILAEERNHEPRMDICFGLDARDVRKGRLCRIGSTKAETPSFLLWGDSHADALLPAVQKVAEEHGRAGLFAGTNSCAPLLGVSRPDALPCRPFNDAVARLLIKRPAIRDVILDARWSKNAYGTARGEGDGRTYLSDDQGEGTDLASTEAVFYRGLERTVRMLTNAGKHVTIVASVPEAGYSVPRVMAHLRMAGNKTEPTRNLQEFLAHQKFIFATMAAMQKKYGVKIVYPHRILCASGACELALDDRPLYRDEHHLSVFGAMQLTPMLAQTL